MVEPDMLTYLLAVLAVAAQPSDLLDEARARARAGDFEGAALVSAEAMRTPGDHVRQAQYLHALALEYGGSLELALVEYDALLASWPADTPSDDVVFRRAETLGRLGEWRRAQQGLRALGDPALRPLGDQVKIGVLYALWDLERGRERRGLRALDELLDRMPATASPFYQAAARARLAELAVASADTIVFRGSDSQRARQLEERSTYVVMAKEQLEEIIRLDEIAHTLPALLSVAQAHEQFATALLRETPPRRLSDEETARYRDQLSERAVALLLKTLRYYTKAVEYAESRGWTGEPLPALNAGVERVRTRIERLDP